MSSCHPPGEPFAPLCVSRSTFGAPPRAPAQSHAHRVGGPLRLRAGRGPGSACASRRQKQERTSCAA
ncbi:MAG: hypothetical protein WKG07_47305 [Hymenobacter sp.]